MPVGEIGVLTLMDWCMIWHDIIVDIGARMNCVNRLEVYSLAND